MNLFVFIPSPQNAKYVWNKADFDAVNPENTDFLMGKKNCSIHKLLSMCDKDNRTSHTAQSRKKTVCHSGHRIDTQYLTCPHSKRVNQTGPQLKSIRLQSHLKPQFAFRVTDKDTFVFLCFCFAENAWEHLNKMGYVS